MANNKGNAPTLTGVYEYPTDGEGPKVHVFFGGAWVQTVNAVEEISDGAYGKSLEDIEAEEQRIVSKTMARYLAPLFS